MDAEGSGHLEKGKREGRVLFGWSKRRKISRTRPANCQRRARDWEPYLLSSEPVAGLARACAARVKCDPAFDRNNYRPRDHIVSSALRRRHAAVANERADASPDCPGIELSRCSRTYRSTGLGEAGCRYHSAAGEAATARRQHYFIARRRRRSFANGDRATAHS